MISTPEYAAYFCSYQVPTVVVELRDALLDSGDNFSSRYFAKKKLVEWKAFVDTVRIKNVDLEDKFLF